jgi:hypothetical protein
MPNFDVCAGGTVSAGETSITFTNHRSNSCTLSDNGTANSLLALTGDSSIVVPAKSGTPPVNGTKTVDILSAATPGTYTYSSACCDRKKQNPSIIYQ